MPPFFKLKQDFRIAANFSSMKLKFFLSLFFFFSDSFIFLFETMFLLCFYFCNDDHKKTFPFLAQDFSLII